MTLLELNPHSEIASQECEPVSRFLDSLRRRLAGAVSRPRLDPDQDRSGSRLCGLERRGVLERMARDDTIVVIRRRNQRRL